MIFMAAPGYAPNMVFAGTPSGDVYQSNGVGLIIVGSGGAPDQLFLQNAGCVTLTPFSAYALPPLTGWKPAVTSNLFPSDQSGLNNGKLMSCRAHYATVPLSGTIRLTFLNILNNVSLGDYWDNGAFLNMGPIVINGTICYPGPNNVIGSYSAIALSPGAMVDVFVTLSATIPGGAKFYEGCFAVPGSGQQVPILSQAFAAANTAAGEGVNLSTSATDQTANLSSISGASTGGSPGLYGCSAICAVQPLSQPVVAVNGDSLEAGSGAGFDAFNQVGPVSWGCSDLVPVINTSKSGKTAAIDAGAAYVTTGYADAMSARRAFYQHCNVTHFFCCLGTNDVIAATAAATTEANLTTIANRAAAIGLVPAVATLPPYTTSSDSWATTGNQTVTANEAIRTAINTWARTTPAPFTSFVDFCVAVESTPASGKWAVTGAANYATSDGIHWSPAAASIAMQKVNASALAVSVPATALGYADTYGQGLKTVQAALDLVLGREANPGVTKLTTDANHTYAPYIEGRAFYDSAALTADRKLILVATNTNGVAIPDGHTVTISRKGSSGGHNRVVDQADGSTLIANIADGATATFKWVAADSLWRQFG